MGLVGARDLSDCSPGSDGGSADDQLQGGSGNDKLRGGGGIDGCLGGAGTNTFATCETFG